MLSSKPTTYILIERTVPRADELDHRLDCFQLFSFLGGFLQMVMELKEVNSVNQKLLSTNWPQDEIEALTPMT